MPQAKDGDVFVMRLILHDWDDKDCVTILSNVRKAMGAAKARLLIVEVCISARFLTKTKVDCYGKRACCMLS